MKRKSISGIILTLIIASTLCVAFNVAPVLTTETTEDYLSIDSGYFVDAVGSYFEITNSTYLNVTLTSTETIYVMLGSAPKMISFFIESNNSATSATLTFSGFEPSNLYYRYQDGYLIESFTTDLNGGYTYTQDVSEPHHVFIQEEEIIVHMSQSTSQPTTQGTLYPWPMLQHDPRHTGYSLSPAPNTNETLWTYATGGSVRGASPAVADGMVFIGSVDRKVYALDQMTGALIWSYTTGSWIGSSPAVADGMVFISSNDRFLYALDEYTGALIWKYYVDRRVSWWSSPAVADGMVFIFSGKGVVFALDEYTGALIWKYDTGHAGRVMGSSPAVADGMVFIGGLYGNIYALDEYTGALIWRHTVQPESAFWSAPTVVDGMVFITAGTAYNHDTYALNATTGALIWSYTTGYTKSSPAVADGMVFVGSYNGKVYALNETTGTLIWTATTGGEVSESSPAVADGMVFVGSYDRKVYALDQMTGALIWSYTTGGQVRSSPAVADGMVFVGSYAYDRKVYAFGPKAIPATIDSDPDTLNLQSNGEWVTAYITLPEGYLVEDIDVATVEMSHGDFVSAAEWGEIQGGVLMVKFDRIALRDYLGAADLTDGDKFYDVTLTVTGEVAGTRFEGSDTIVVIKR